MKTEFEIINALKRRIQPIPGGLGIGDDAALFSSSKGNQLVFATDVIVENVDFIFAKSNSQDVGRKALAVNLSDLAAMGAKPLAFVITLGLSKKVRERWIQGFYRGILKLAKQHGIYCVGGDLTSSKTVFANVAVIGEAKPNHTVKRSGAKVGDWIGVTGSFGGSIKRKHFHFTPRLKEGRFLSAKKYANAMIDVSDGLLQDIGHMLKSSKKGALIELDQVPISKDAVKIAKNSQVKALKGSLTDGEDFELCFTVSNANKNRLDKSWPKHFPRTKLSWIGRVQTGRKIKFKQNGKKTQYSVGKKKGYQHF